MVTSMSASMSRSSDRLRSPGEAPRPQLALGASPGADPWRWYRALATRWSARRVLLCRDAPTGSAHQV